MAKLFHDLKNQLTIVLGIAHLILNTADGLTYDNVKTIEFAGHKMNELLAVDDNNKASCTHLIAYCYTQKRCHAGNEDNKCDNDFTFNYCPDCGQQLMKGE